MQINKVRGYCACRPLGKSVSTEKARRIMEPFGHNIVNSRECAICLQPLEHNAQDIFTHSGDDGERHPFHQSCIDTWKKVKKFCPVCQTSLEELGQTQEVDLEDTQPLIGRVTVVSTKDSCHALTGVIFCIFLLAGTYFLLIEPFRCGLNATNCIYPIRANDS